VSPSPEIRALGVLLQTREGAVAAATERLSIGLASHRAAIETLAIASERSQRAKARWLAARSAGAPRATVAATALSQAEHSRHVGQLRAAHAEDVDAERVAASEVDAAADRLNELRRQLAQCTAERDAVRSRIERAESARRRRADSQADEASNEAHSARESLKPIGKPTRRRSG